MEGGTLLGEKLLKTMETLGDVTFEVGPTGEEEEVKCFLFLLRTLSPVFETMFNENWKRQERVVKLPDVNAKVFRHFLKLLVTDNLKAKHLDELKLTMDETLNMLYTANKYDTKLIQPLCRSSIKAKIAIKNVVNTYNQLVNMNEPELEKNALDFMIAHIEDLLSEESLKELFKQTFILILERKALPITELSLFQGMVRWAGFQCDAKDIPCTGKSIREELGQLLFLISFPGIRLPDFYSTVEPMGILTAEEVINISRCHALEMDLKHIDRLEFNKQAKLATKGQLQYFVFCPSAQQILWKVHAFSHCSNDTLIRNTVSSVISSTRSTRHPNECSISRLSTIDRSASRQGSILIPTLEHITYRLKFAVLNDSWKVLSSQETTASKSDPLKSLEMNLKTPVGLELNSTYYIYYSVEGKDGPMKTSASITGGVLNIAI